ncbi:hypothetical protein NJ7G_1366 [Natrinema sp. J7-2]|nr:hypothetical protein NJ7G_1366 [Natrinema sp. J7-2]
MRSWPAVALDRAAELIRLVCGRWATRKRRRKRHRTGESLGRVRSGETHTNVLLPAKSGMNPR